MMLFNRTKQISKKLRTLLVYATLNIIRPAMSVTLLKYSLHFKVYITVTCCFYAKGENCP
jgi:hypothetical protein